MGVLRQRARRAGAVRSSLVLGVVLLLAAPGAAPGFPGANGALVFVRDGTLWTMAADGSAQASLGVTGSAPALSADAARLAYVDGGGAVVTRAADLSGSTNTLAAAGSSPAWSPDGSQVAYVAGGTVRKRAWDAGAGETDTGLAGSEPAWSPDGATIAVASGGEIQAFSATAGAPTLDNLSDSPGSTESGSTWSPDGTRIAYLSTATGTTEIFVMNADGTGQTRLTNNALTEAGPVWSPDGTAIVFAAGDDIRSIPAAAGTPVSSLTTDGGATVDASPDWGIGFALSTPVIDGPSPPSDGVALSVLPVSVSGGGTPTGSPSYQWLRCGAAGASCTEIAGATSATYTVGSLDVGSTIRVRVTQGSTAGSASATSNPTGTVLATAPTSSTLPVITGAATATVGVALTASAGTWTGTTPIAFTYQWQRCDASGGSCTNATGATSTSYVPVSGDVGSTLRVAVTANNGVGAPVSATSGPTAVVVSNLPVNTAPPTVASSSLKVGTVATAAPGTWTGAATITFKYQWKRCDGDGTSCADVVGATLASYTLANADAGKRMRVAVTATNSFGSATATSAATDAVDAVGPTSSVRPTVSGEAKAGQLLTASTGSWLGTSPFSFTFEWRRCNASGASCTVITGATASSYVLTAADVGSTIVVYVTASNAAGSATASSNPTAVVSGGAGAPARGAKPRSTAPPGITGVAGLAYSLVAAPGKWAGAAPMTHSYQWQRCNRQGAACRAIARATRRTYTLVRGDVGSRLLVVVTAANAGGSTSARSATTDVVAAKAKAVLGTRRGDKLVGSRLKETILGRQGNDRIWAGAGDDWVFGEAGSDYVSAGTGRDVVRGGAGNDRIHVLDGARDVVDCGDGAKDVVLAADRVDAVTGCERVVRKTFRSR